MKYIFLFFIFLVSVYFFLTLNLFDNKWHYIQPMLIGTLLVYFNTDNSWIHYIFALLAGLFIDALSPVFGLQAIILVSIIFMLTVLQLTFFTSRNMFSVIALSSLACLFFWLLFYLLNFIFSWVYYDWSQLTIKYWILAQLINIFMVSALHILYFNLWSKKHESR